MHGQILIKTGDITQEAVCAVVNAANRSLLGGGGVDGAIHRAGGGAILAACQALRKEAYKGGLPTGEAVATTAGVMPAEYVIHTVGPIYSQCGEECARLLRDCYTNALVAAVELGCHSIAFPAISTGIYGYPKREAARVAYAAVNAFLEDTDAMEVRFVFHNEESKRVFQEAIGHEILAVDAVIC